MCSDWELTLCFVGWLFIDFRETSICCSSYRCIRWLILVCALTGEGTHNLGMLWRCSNQPPCFPGQGEWVVILMSRLLTAPVYPGGHLRVILFLILLCCGFMCLTDIIVFPCALLCLTEQSSLSLYLPLKY